MAITMCPKEWRSDHNKWIGKSEYSSDHKTNEDIRWYTDIDWLTK